MSTVLRRGMVAACSCTAAVCYVHPPAYATNSNSYRSTAHSTNYSGRADFLDRMDYLAERPAGERLARALVRAAVFSDGFRAFLRDLERCAAAAAASRELREKLEPRRREAGVPRAQNWASFVPERRARSALPARHAYYQGAF